jgi:polyhydroxyalkanoate synthase
MEEGPLQALKIIEELTGARRINVLGYCIGGTLLGCALSHLAKKEEKCIQSATFLTTLFDFSEPGQLGVFLSDERHLSMLEEYVQEQGYLDGPTLTVMFNSLRSKELVWDYYVDNYLKGNRPKPFDLFHWTSDPTNISAKTLIFYLRNTYLSNQFIQPNAIRLGDETLDLTAINIPTYYLAAHEDHIVPWIGCFRSQQILKGPVRFALAKAGHVGGIVNPPHKKKYGYWASNKKYQKGETFKKYASFYEGSWWVDWLEWLKSHGGEQIAVDPEGFHPRTVIEEAPGSYVRQHCLSHFPLREIASP